MPPARTGVCCGLTVSLIRTWAVAICASFTGAGVDACSADAAPPPLAAAVAVLESHQQIGGP